MKVVVQRVARASVTGQCPPLLAPRTIPCIETVVSTVGEKEVSSIGRGLCVLLGITREDTAKESEWM